MKCKICDSQTEKLFKAKVLNKYEIQYYRCPKCHFIQTEKEYWIGEAYKSSINLSDTGILQRNIILGFKTSLLIFYLFKRKKIFIDYGGGFGIFTRFMRDIGFDFYWYDPYTKNELARSFDADLNKKYEMLTFFEGVEHLLNPKEDFNKIFQLSDTIVFSTTLVPSKVPKQNEWWYYCFEHGQHISLYTKETFEYIAKKYSCNFYTDGKYFHMFSKKKISKFSFRFLSSIIGYLLLPLVLLVCRSKTVTDHKNLKNAK